MPNALASTITPTQLAARWGVSEAALSTQRTLDTGPSFRRRGRFVLYDMRSVLEAERRRDAAVEGDGLLKIADVVEMTGLSRSTLYRWQASGQFPPAVKLSRGVIRWSSAQVRAWIAEVKASA